MEIILLTVAVAVLGGSVLRFKKAREIVINDFPHPDTYATPDYANAFNQAFDKAGVKFKHYNAS